MHQLLPQVVRHNPIHIHLGRLLEFHHQLLGPLPKVPVHLHILEGEGLWRRVLVHYGHMVDDTEQVLQDHHIILALVQVPMVEDGLELLRDLRVEVQMALGGGLRLRVVHVVMVLLVSQHGDVVGRPFSGDLHHFLVLHSFPTPVLDHHLHCLPQVVLLALVVLRLSLLLDRVLRSCLPLLVHSWLLLLLLLHLLLVVFHLPLVGSPERVQTGEEVKFEIFLLFLDVQGLQELLTKDPLGG
mmetsp:Transcript_29073/g.28017  ORF Transcript_29073/g.28017 Transcript_29073/m.28017 type:complete len:241 (+) Transcript_29073:680-1402(+)